METKVCVKCNEEKELNLYRKTIKNGKIYYRGECKKCISLKMKSYQKNYYIENSEYLKNNMKNYYIENIYDRTLYNKNYRENNRDKCLEYTRLWNLSNIEKIKNYKILNKEKYREYNKNYFSFRLKTDELFRLKSIVRKRICYILNNKNYSSELIIGCSFEEFKLHLENNFEDWMTWVNYGKYNGCEKYGWDIDHIIPLSSAINEEELLKLNHFSNIQPLCSYINRVIKKDKINFYY